MSMSRPNPIGEKLLPASHSKRTAGDNHDLPSSHADILPPDIERLFFAAYRLCAKIIP
jgi:hypothetical protein